MVSIGLFLKMVFFQYILRNYKIHRLLFQTFQHTYIGKGEKEIQ